MSLFNKWEFKHFYRLWLRWSCWLTVKLFIKDVLFIRSKESCLRACFTQKSLGFGLVAFFLGQQCLSQFQTTELCVQAHIDHLCLNQLLHDNNRDSVCCKPLSLALIHVLSLFALCLAVLSSNFSARQCRQVNWFDTVIQTTCHILKWLHQSQLWTNTKLTPYWRRTVSELCKHIHIQEPYRWELSAWVIHHILDRTLGALPHAFSAGRQLQHSIWECLWRAFSVCTVCDFLTVVEYICTWQNNRSNKSQHALQIVTNWLKK